MRCQELKAFRWWLIFERARRFESRRRPESEALYNFMVASELGLHEEHIHSPDLVLRIQRIKLARAARDRVRTNRVIKPVEGPIFAFLQSAFGAADRT